MKLGDQRADDRADRVGGVDAADQPRRILLGRRDRRERQRKARAPQDRARQHHPQAAHQIELEREPRRRSRCDGLIGQYGSDSVSSYAAHAIARAQQQLAPAERAARRCDVARERRADACCRCRGRAGTPRGSARRCRPSRRTAATAAASRPLRRRARSCPTARSRRRRHAAPRRRRARDRRRDVGVVRRAAARARSAISATDDVERDGDGRSRSRCRTRAAGRSRRAGCRPRRRRCCRRRRSRATTTPSGVAFDPARDRRQRRAHQHRRRQQADAGDDRAEDDAGDAARRAHAV